MFSIAGVVRIRYVKNRFVISSGIETEGIPIIIRVLYCEQSTEQSHYNTRSKIRNTLISKKLLFSAPCWLRLITIYSLLVTSLHKPWSTAFNSKAGEQVGGWIAGVAWLGRSDKCGRPVPRHVVTRGGNQENSAIMKWSIEARIGEAVPQIVRL
jgi:hypothetical protein